MAIFQIPPKGLQVRGAHLKRTTAGSAVFTNGAWVAAPWEGVHFDTDGFWSSGAAARLTIPAGSNISRVMVGGDVLIGNSASTSHYSNIRKNGSSNSIGYSGVHNSAAVGNIVTGPLDVVPGDYFEFTIYNAAGTAYAFHTEVARSGFWLIVLA